MPWRERFAGVPNVARARLVALSLLAAAAPVLAQPSLERVDGVGEHPHSRMCTKLEKTIFKVDVLNLEVWLGEADGRRIGELIEGRRYSEDLAESVSEVAIDSRNALARIEFLRDVSLEQFLDGIDENLRLVPEAGVIERSDYELISSNLPRWFAFLEERGISEGDQILYRIRGDSLTTRYRAVDGAILLEQTDVGPGRRLAVLGGYFVRGSEFRVGLIKSLFEDE